MGSKKQQVKTNDLPDQKENKIGHQKEERSSPSKKRKREETWKGYQLPFAGQLRLFKAKEREKARSERLRRSGHWYVPNQTI